MTKFDKGQKMIVAALFARSNMGQPRPEAAELRRLFDNNKRRPIAHLSTPVISLCQQYMESDEHEKMFMAEARMWLRDKRLNSLESVAEIWPDMAALLTAALGQIK